MIGGASNSSPGGGGGPCVAWWRGVIGRAVPSRSIGDTPLSGLRPATSPCRRGVAGALLASLLLAACIADARPAANLPVAYAATGIASWYGDELAGNRTASGERFDPGGYTAAHRTLPLGSLAEVTDVETGRAILVRINDRGPHHRNRVIDLSHGAARLLGTDRKPTATVRIRAVAEGREGRVVFAGRGGHVMASPPPPPGRYLVQVGSFSSRDRAAALADRLGADLVDAGEVWRVRLGPLDASKAQAARDAVAARGYADAQLIATSD